MIQIFPNLKTAISFAGNTLKTYGAKVNTGSWQGIKQEVEMFEYDNLYFRACMPQSQLALETQVRPDMPWAEDHFQERVTGEPLNPGEQYRKWPYYKDSSFNDKNFRNVDEKFSHTYMERYWPKYAGLDKLQENESKKVGGVLRGIRYEYGDLNDVISLLLREPYTRQAYLPVWFPEDTGVKHGGRVPCSLGYHFMRKGDDLQVHYTIRACDYLRHFRNDIYLTVRLCQWVLEKLQYLGDGWGPVSCGILTMDIIHFHVFAKEQNII
jgi:hypothetical protein